MGAGFGAGAADRAGRWQSVAARHWAGLLGAICLLALLGRLAAMLLVPQPVESDAQQYLCMARTLVELGTLRDCDGNLAYYSAGYPLLLALLFWLLGAKLWVAYAANLVLGTLSVLLAGLVARALTRSSLAGLCAAAGLAVYIESVLYADYLLKENLVIPLLLLQVWLVLGWRSWRRRALLLGLFGASLAGQALTGMTSLAALPAFAAYLLATCPERRLLLREGLCVALIAALCLAPWLWRNERAVGAPVLNTNGGVNLYVGNNAKAGLMFTRLWDTAIGPSWHALRDGEGEYVADRTLRALALGYMRDYPLQAARRWLERFLAFWAPPVQKIADDATGMAERLMRLVWLAQYLLVIALALVPLLRRAATRPQLALLYGSVLLCAAAYAPFFIIYRFRLPIMVLLCIAAGWGVALLLQALGRAAAMTGTPAARETAAPS
jgi:4-amino-4-deoxy-L-arabinose transferase-like glycosyltransferase